MPQLSSVQKRIAAQLVKGPLPALELAQKSKVGQLELADALKPLVKVGLVKVVEGYPVKYQLDEKISAELQRRRHVEEEDANKLRVRVIIEAQAIESELLKKTVAKIRENLESEPHFKVYAFEEAEAVQEGEYYSTYLDANVSVKDFRALMRLMLFYGPTSVEVVKPNKVEFSLDELQEGLVDLTEMIHAYVDYIHGLLGKKELEEFHQRLYGQK
ncbi:MAG: hypothetical protein HY393_02345 [Candidatus Diapherotrites archaeon]|nr:hypothetical protein [Candidatus Diapherotrites archaeon]